MEDLLSMKFRYSRWNYFFNDKLYEGGKTGTSPNGKKEPALFIEKSYSFSERDQYEIDLEKSKELLSKSGVIHIDGFSPHVETIRLLNPEMEDEYDEEEERIDDKIQETVEKLKEIAKLNGINVGYIISVDRDTGDPLITYDGYKEDCKNLDKFYLNKEEFKDGKIVIYVKEGHPIVKENGVEPMDFSDFGYF